MNPIYKLHHKIQMLKDFLQLLSTGPVTEGGGGGGGGGALHLRFLFCNIVCYD